VEAAPAAPADVTVSRAFAAGAFQYESLDVEKGRDQRSLVRTVDVTFTTSANVQAIVNSVNDADGGNDRVRLTRFGLDGGGPGAAVALTNVQAVDRVMALDFGANGLDDGYYALAIDLDGDGTIDETLHFYRLRGDVNGDRKVDDVDIALIGDANKFDWEDLNRDGRVDVRDRQTATQIKNDPTKRLNDLLFLDD
jgi:hypothetical protein